jgi:hypothetical protein
MSFDEDFQKMKAVVRAAEDEIVLAAMFHETWRPTAFDESLRVRMGTSYATHSFNVVRIALRREMILALMRVWDSNKAAVRMTAVAEKLKDKKFFQQLVARRAAHMGMKSQGVEATVGATLEPKRQEALALIRKYGENGSGHEAFKRIRALRDERLAHRQTDNASTARQDPDDTEVEAFYDDSLSAVTLLLSIVLAKAFELSGAGDVYRRHANFFGRAPGESALRDIPTIARQREASSDIRVKRRLRCRPRGNA